MNASEFLSAVYEDFSAIDLLLVDLRLPGINGDKLVTWLRESEVEQVNSLPVVIATGHPWEVPDALAQNDHRVRVLLKPFLLKELEAAMFEVLERPTLH